MTNLRTQYDDLDKAVLILHGQVIQLMIDYRIKEYNQRMQELTKEEYRIFDQQYELLAAIEKEEQA